jgi:hypothetical protein
MRVRAGAEREGDLGRAAAAFEEALRLRPDDAEAEHALDVVRGEVARRRSTGGKDVVRVRPTFDRIVVSWMSERGWAIAAIVASFLFAVGLVLRRHDPGPLHVTGILLVPLGLVATVLLVPLYYGARHLRMHTRPAVVVVTEVTLTKSDGAPVSDDPIPEAARVEVSTLERDRAFVRYGAHEGWVPSASVRLLRE